MITSSGFGASRLPQNLGAGPNVEDHPTILGVRRLPQKGRRDLAKLGGGPRRVGIITISLHLASPPRRLASVGCTLRRLLD